uniref:Uncharacterized protein n=1 Tax=Picea glauca TaxID=3330 RepID=A0A117NH15_PICGL|nr:hypothetical protein ABT39_MTgene5877 [Picea glauca]
MTLQCLSVPCKGLAMTYVTCKGLAMTYVTKCTPGSLDTRFPYGKSSN